MPCEAISDDKKKTFLLCPGAHRTGTTWLHQYIGKNSSVDFGFAKEYHVLDSMYSAHHQPEKVKYVNRLKKLFYEGSVLQPKNVGVLKHLEFLCDESSYYDYFQFLLLRSNETALTGDFTPSYSLIPQQAYENCVSAFSSRNIRVKTIFILRDPFERLWSACKFTRDMHRQKSFFKRTDAQRLRKMYRDFGHEARSRYEIIIPKIDAVFPPADRLFIFYEELFQENQIRHICEFLNLEYRIPELEQPVNMSRDFAHSIPESLRHDVVQYYKSTYDFVGTYFGFDKINQIWPNFKLLS